MGKPLTHNTLSGKFPGVTYTGSTKWDEAALTRLGVVPV